MVRFLGSDGGFRTGTRQHAFGEMPSKRVDLSSRAACAELMHDGWPMHWLQLGGLGGVQVHDPYFPTLVLVLPSAKDPVGSTLGKVWNQTASIVIICRIIFVVSDISCAF